MLWDLKNIIPVQDNVNTVNKKTLHLRPEF
jgi:hypothetical protein